MKRIGRTALSCTIVASIFFVLIFVPPAWGADTDAAIFAADEWEDYTNSDGTGLYFDILKAVYEPAGIEVRHRIVPFKRAMMLAGSGEADAVVGVYYTKEGESAYPGILPEYPIGTEQTAAVFKKGAVKDWQGQKSLEGKNVLWLRGYNYHKFLDVKTNWSEIDDRSQAFAMMNLGRADFYVDDIDDLKAHMKENSIPMADYRIETVAKDNLYVRFTKSDKGRRLAQIYDERIPKLSEAGKIESIFKRYGMDYVPLAPREK